MPTYPPPQWNLAGSNWYVGIKLATPLGTVSDVFALQPNASGIGGNVLLAVNQGAGAATWPPNQNLPIPQYGVIKSNADLLATLGYTSLPAALSGSVLNGNTLNPAIPPAGWPVYFIGINAGIRPGGYLGCNLSISYLPQGGQKITQFWQQDISAYRLWNISEWSYYNTGIPGWFYQPPTFLPDWYVPQSLLPGNGRPIWATWLSPNYGQLYKKVLPDATQFTPPTLIFPGDQQQWNTFIANWPTTSTSPPYTTYTNTWAFLGDVFQTSPYLAWRFGTGVGSGSPLYAWSFQPQGISTNGFCVPLTQPGFLSMPVVYDQVDHPAESVLPRTTWDGSIPQVPFFVTEAGAGYDWLFNQGIGVGLGCSLYWLYVTQNLETFFN